VFSRVENGQRSIWKADPDGRGAIRLTHTVSGRFAVTSDGKHVIYVLNDKGVQSPWVASLDGGEPRQLVKQFSYLPAASRDGKWLAFVSTNQQGQAVLSTCALADCASPRTFAVARGPIAVQWTPNGRGVAYATLANIWVQPVDGGAPTQLTRFAEDDHRIEDFEWSADGKRLAVSRARTTWDIVLFRGMKR
jgi:Tol biopolymer transport system component